MNNVPLMSDGEPVTLIPEIFTHLGLHEVDFLPLPADPTTGPSQALAVAAADLTERLAAIKDELDRRGVVIAGLIPEYVVACVEKTATTMPEEE